MYIEIHRKNDVNKQYLSDKWLDLSEAARFLGVHFTTLRRWADAGQVACIRTPGGRRRFSMSDLQTFVNSMRQPDSNSLSLIEYSKAVQHAPQKIHNISSTSGSWLDRLGGNEREHMRNIGQHLMALMMQFTSRKGDGHVFLEEGKRIAGEYGQLCHKTGLPVTDTIRIFLLFQRSILGAIQETEKLGDDASGETRQLFQRANDFFDELFVTLVENYFNHARLPS
jgi:excisionase family DNA binding protein